MTDRPVAAAGNAYISAVCQAAGHEDRLTVMAAVTLALRRVTGWSPSDEVTLARLEGSPTRAVEEVAAIDPPASVADAWLLGSVHEALLAPSDRRMAGAHYTPRQVASGLLAWAVDGWDAPGSAVLCDPACGGGAFLLAGAERLLAGGAPPAAIVQDLLWGIDVDPTAVAVTEAALSLWAWQHGAPGVTPSSHLACGDALRRGSDVWQGSEPPPQFDLVAGNPPFQSQLGRSTARAPAAAAALRERYGDAATGYADSASLFLLAACRMTRPGGRVALVQPLSMFAARDSRRTRTALLDGARLDAVWTAAGRVFRANVRVGAVVLELDGGPASGTRQPGYGAVVRRAAGVGFDPLPAIAVDHGQLKASPSWSPLIAATDTPVVDARVGLGRLGDIASATAGFRDQYYGLIPFVAEAGDRPGAPLVTSGLIDPARSRWGEAPSRFAGCTWTRPTVDVDALIAEDPRLGAWLQRLLVPKVLVAAQTRVVEAVVDADGVCVPSVPVIAVCADPARLFDVAAVLLAPHTSAWAVRRAAGTALSGDAIKLSATQVLDVPLPRDAGAWSAGAEHLRRAGSGLGDAAAFAAIMDRAYGVDPASDLAAWWLARVPIRA